MSINPSDYDQALICDNGHVATSMLRRAPQHQAPFCERCGAPNISTCPNCERPIRGYYFGGGITLGWDAPPYCVYCGKPYPWTVKAMEAAHEAVDDTEELTPDERERLKRSIEDVATDNPKTEASARRIRKMLDRLPGTAGEMIEKVATAVATEAAKRILLGGP